MTSQSNNEITISNSNNSSSNSGSTSQPMTLSHYLHTNIFEPILYTNKSAQEKYDCIDRIHSFLSGKDDDNDKTTMSETKVHSLKDKLFSPLVSDVHLTINRPTEQKSNLSSKGVLGIQSGIQLPLIDWQKEFRKSYSVLMWVRFHHDHESDDDDNNDNDDSDDVILDDSSSVSSIPSTFSKLHEQPEPQLLYRFATSSSPMAHGVQATLHKDTTYYEERRKQKGQSDHNKNKYIPVIIRVETLRPQPPSKIDNIHSIQLPNSLTTKRILIPNGEWTLLCIQHSFPYLKKPLVSVSMNGVEIQKAEMTYPALGGEAGEVMMDNYILCNIPTMIESRHCNVVDNSSNGKKKGGNKNISSSCVLDNISKVDFAGFGLFKEVIPTLVQAIICEHGPCTSADGVIPSVPPVVQSRDGIVVGTTAASEESYNNRGGSNSVVGSPKRGAAVSSGPFGLSSHRMPNASEGRGIGIPLCTGVQLTEDVSHKGDLFIQQLLSKLVLGLNGSSSFKYGDKIGLTVNSCCNVGLTSDVKMVGIVQAKQPSRRSGEERQSRVDTAQGVDEQNGTIARGIGNLSIYHSTIKFLDIEMNRIGCDDDCQVSLPKYNMSNSNVTGFNPIPSFVSTYLSLDSISYILQPFHLALPPPGNAHSLQQRLYHDSFDHLYDLVVYNGGALAAKLIDLFVTNLYLGGRMREEIIHRGSLHTLVVLLRKVLLRACRLRLWDCKEKSAMKRLWETYSPKESPDDGLHDITSAKDTAPSYIPPSITNACQSLITACCGPSVLVGKRWKRPPLSIHVRRTSDIAMTAIFGFVLDFDLWGGDLVSASKIMREFADLYCTDGFEGQDKNSHPELTEKYDSGYGRILRGQISVQHFLDLVRLHFGNEIILQSNDNPSERTKALKSLSSSLSRILYVLLKYSLVKQVSQGENDISAVVGALSDCPLGSVGAHLVLSALNDILIYCELVPKHQIGKHVHERNEDQSKYIQLLIEGTNFNKNTSSAFQQSIKLKRAKSEIAGRLARNLLLGQFHDVVAPMLLSRTVFDGRRTIVENGVNLVKDEQKDSQSFDSEFTKSSYGFQNHWILALQLFIVS